MTHIRSRRSKRDVLYGALHAAWKLRVEKSAKSGQKKKRSPKDSLGTPKRKSKRG